jgi:hypothetical protein
MQHPGFELPRKSIPRTKVNKGNSEGSGLSCSDAHARTCSISSKK